MPFTRRLATTSRTTYAIVFLGSVLLVLRALQLSQRTLYWDDLLIPARYSALSFTGIFQLHDNHLMPGSVLIQTLIAQVAPLQWLPPALITLTLTLVSFLLWIPVMRQLVPDRPQLRILGLSLLCFSPFLMDAAGWWSAALNAYAWQCCCAAVLFVLLRPGNPWQHSAMAALILLTGLVFTEKALTILPVAIAVLWIRHYFAAKQVTVEAQRYIFPLLVVVGWLMLYLPRLDYGVGTTPVGGIPQALFQAIIPGTLGGPWQWQRWQPAKAFADPNPLTCGLAIIFALAFVCLLAYRRPQRLLISIPILGYLVILWFMLLTARTGAATTELLLRSMHYYSDWWTFAVLAGLASTQQVFLKAPTQSVLTCLFLISAIISTYTWTAAWKDDTAKEYLTNVRKTLANSSDPILDQQTPLEILTPLTHPYNRVSAITMTTPVNITTKPQVFDAHGTVHPAEVAPVAFSKLGPEPNCGYRVMAGQSVTIPIEPLLQFGDWVWEFNALASAENMTLTITTPNALEPITETNNRAITVTAPTELRQHWVRVPGGGNQLKIDVAAQNPTSSVCIGAGAIGPLVPVG